MTRRRETPEQLPGTPEQQEEEATVEEAGAENAGDGPAWSPEEIVKHLPEGTVLCPTCLGMLAVVDDPPYDPRAYACEVCSGHGKLRTGSQVGGQGDRPCWACGGRGWVEAAPTELDALPARAAFFADPERPPVDVHGRTPDDPDFDWARVVAQPAQRPLPTSVAPDPAVAAGNPS